MRALLIVLTLLATAAGAQDKYPTRPITIVNPYAAGSSMDIMARAVADQFTRTWGQGVVVTSRDGASGVVGMTAMMLAAPDGYTLAFSPMVPVVVQPHLNRDSRVNPDTVQPVCGVTENILGIAVRTESPLKNMADLLAATRVKPLAFGSPGPNSGPFLAIDEIARKQKTEFVHVPYKGDAPSLTDTLSGRLDFSAIVAASAASFVKADRMRMLAVMSTKRHPGYPDTPTLIEAGLDTTQLSYAGLFAPKGLPEPVLRALDEACAVAVSSDAFKQAASNTNQVIEYQPRAAWERKVHEEFKRQGAALKAAGALKE